MQRNKCNLFMLITLLFCTYRYSVFTVMSLNVPSHPTDADPIIMHISAAIDNR